MGIAISSIGLATAQGSRAAISAGSNLCGLEPWPWPINGWSTSQYCRPAAGVNSGARGVTRWRELAQLALADCVEDQSEAPGTPILIASCNGSADSFDGESWRRAFDSASLLEGTAWAGQRSPVFTSSCNSGLHALYAARQILLSGQMDQVIVLAVDILSHSNQDNFEALRVLSDTICPWQPASTGFILGEAAVALKLVRETDSSVSVRLSGPALSSELMRDDGLPHVLKQVSGMRPQLLLGQGTGPFANDESELAAFRTCVAGDVPLTTSLVHFGHTLGVSGLLSIALAALIEQAPDTLSTLVMPAPHASDGRPLSAGAGGDVNAERIRNVLVSCRALNGSCAAALVSTQSDLFESERSDVQLPRSWHTPAPIGPLMHPTLRQLASEAPANRPLDPPDVLVVHLDEPLAPPPTASIGGRLLPSAVLEMTPGFVSQLIARCWGFAGPALCLVGHGGANTAASDFGAACSKLGLIVTQIHLRGTGDEREIVWSD
ncbi:MAG TPA: beta-ketoacyl synthase N-terminal-like domain-containing protein [Pyrinomonadaceae bacterium]